MFAGSRLLLPVYINCVTLVPETREEGGTRCQRALAAEGDRGAEEIGQQEVAETVFSWKDNSSDSKTTRICMLFHTL